MTYGAKVRSVSFNLDNPSERAMYDFSKRTNFNRLVKQCLAREMKRHQKLESGAEASIQVKLGDSQ
ncbi:hypothetical protein AAC03nite_34370 [Alicyclobacillus acidoterrestris]|nr:hypothetical protein AAC03nite_34370 [Alicyclobacillus acidoterrestris]